MDSKPSLRVLIPKSNAKAFPAPVGKNARGILYGKIDCKTPNVVPVPPQATRMSAPFSIASFAKIVSCPLYFVWSIKTENSSLSKTE